MADELQRLTLALSGRYKLLYKIGSGGMATVYLAEDLKHHRNVAIKVLRPELASALGSRFLREIEMVAKLHHPHILPLYDSGAATPPDGGLEFLYYVMPYIEGESLRDRLEREQQLPLDDALQITREVAEALSYAHAYGVVHRDVKPENILLDAGHALVTDFGVALAITDAPAERLTQTGIAIGTPAYMSPEQAAGNAKIDGRSDVYSLACVLYEMLAGEPPHTGPTPQAILARQISGELRSLAPLRSTIKPAMDETIKRALAPAPADRYATPTQFVEALQAKQLILPERLRWRRRMRLSLGMAGSLVVLAAAALGVRSLLHPRAAIAGSRAATVAVFPFRGTGPNAGSLGEGIADLLAAALDGTVGMTVSDPASLWRPLRRNADVIQAPEVDQAVRLARDVSARSIVMGSLVAAGSQLQIAARLYDADGTLTATATTSTSADSLPSAVDRLAIDIVSNLWQRDSLPTVPVIERLATSSIEALQAYLKATSLKRQGRYAEAEEAIQRAAELDSTFALANMEWFDIRSWVLYLNAQPYSGLTEIIDRAMRYRDRLSPRNRMRVEAMNALNQTEGVQAANLFDQILAIDSSDLDAAQNLAFTYLRDGWQLGKQLEDISAAYDRVLALDSTSLVDLSMRAMLAFQMDDAATANRLIERLSALGGASPGPFIEGRLGALHAIQAAPNEREAALSALASAPVPVVTTALRDLRQLRPALAGVFFDDLMDNAMPPLQQRIGSGARAQLWMAEGRVHAVDSLVRLGALDAVRQTLNRYFVTSALLDVGDSAAALRAARELAAYAPADSISAYMNSKEAVWATAWAVGAYQAALGDTAEARIWQRSLAGQEPGGVPHDWPESLASDIEARIATRRGDFQTALTAAQHAFSLWTIHSNYSGEAHPEPTMRFHLAQLLQATGSADSAAMLYQSLAPPHTWMGFVSARAAFELAEIARSRGETRQASYYYRIAERLWELGDPSVVGDWLDRVRRAERRLGVG